MNKKLFIVMFIFLFSYPIGNGYASMQSFNDQFYKTIANKLPLEFKIASKRSGQEENSSSPIINAITKITNLVVKEEVRRDGIFNVLIPILSVVIMLLIISSLSICFAVFIIKTRQRYKDKRKTAIGKLYLGVIADYVVNKKQYEYPSFQKLSNPLNRVVLIGQIYELSQHLFGPQHNQLLKLFRIRKLLKHVLFKLTISGKSDKALYLKLFSTIIINQTLLHKFYKYLFSEHNELRRFAQLSLLNYDPDALKEILHNYPYYLTLWDQIHFLEIIDRRATIPPDFYFYLESSNPSVVIFGLRMIRIFYQKSPREDIIIDLLSHSNEHIRYEALKTASDLNIEGVNRILLAYLSELGPKYKGLIIEYLINIDMLDDNMVFQLFINENKDLDRLNILKTLYNNSPNGKRILEDLANYTGEENVLSMCKYIFENAI